MAKCKMMPLQPSQTSTINLKNLENRLRHYSDSTSVSTTPPQIGHQWPPKYSSGDDIKLKVSHNSPGARTEEVYSETVIVNSDVESVNSFGSDGGEVEVWADAFEYQEQMLQQPRLSQASTDDDKENSTSGHITKPGWITRDKHPDEDPQETKADDYFARRSRQYEEIPMPLPHKPLQKEDYFTMTNHPTASSGRPPAVMYITNENQLNSLLPLLHGPILSLDLEWLAWNPKKNISLIQLSDASTVLLIQICRFVKFPVKLREIIESPKWIKTGVSIMGADMSRLRDVYNVRAQGVCELSFFARLIDREIHGPKNTLISLSNLSYHYLGSHLAKGPVRCSNWTKMPLSSEQRHYAAIDAYAGYLIFAELERLRQSRPEFDNIWPPVSACPPRKSIVHKAPVKSVPSGPESGATREVRAVITKFSEQQNAEAQAEANTFLRPWRPPASRRPIPVAIAKPAPARRF